MPVRFRRSTGRGAGHHIGHTIGRRLFPAPVFSRMYQRIYLTVLGAILLTVLITGLIIAVLKSDQPEISALRMFTDLVVESLPGADAAPQASQQVLDEWRRRSNAHLGLYDPRGRLLAGSTEINPPDTAWLSGGRHGYESGYANRLPDGSWLIVQLPSRDQAVNWTLAVALAGVSVLIGVMVFPVVRKITARLESLKSTVEAFGDGNLEARADLSSGNDEVASVAQSFNRAASRIEALMNAQKTLLANSSHELRSPLARIQMAVGLLGNGDDGNANDGAAREEIGKSIRELDHLIGEILLASRFEAQNLKAVIDRREFDLTALIAQEAARFDADLQGEHVHLAGDPTLLARLMRNLLENARRYAGGSAIEILVETLDGSTAPREVLISVCDRGPGIPDAERERIFEPFYRIPGSSERDGGVGLGLALVSSIARQHGGRVWAQARAGGGECFCVRLPLQGRDSSSE